MEPSSRMLAWLTGAREPSELVPGVEPIPTYELLIRSLLESLDRTRIFRSNL